MNKFAIRPLIVFGLVGAVALGIAAGAVQLAGAFDELAQQRTDLEAKLDSLRERRVDVSQLSLERASLTKDTLIFRGMFDAASPAAATTAFVDAIVDTSEQTTGAAATVARVEAVKSDDFLELVASAKYELDAGKLGELITAIHRLRPLLFVDGLQISRVHGTNGETPTLNVEAVVRAYSEVTTEETRQ